MPITNPRTCQMQEDPIVPDTTDSSEHPFRAHQASGFVIVPNGAVNDQRLSLRAKGLLAYLLGRPRGWRFSATRIAADNVEGRDAVSSALHELAAAGYYRATRVHGQGGRFVTLTEVAADPRLMPPPPVDTPGAPPADARPDTGSQVSADQVSADQASMSGLKARTESQTPLSPLRGDIPPSTRPSGQRPKGWTAADETEFESWWQVYPRAERKGAARGAWRQARRSATPELLTAGAARYRDDPNREDAYTAHPATWLRAEGWTDPPLPARTSRTPVLRTSELDAGIRARLDRAAQMRTGAGRGQG